MKFKNFKTSQKFTNLIWCIIYLAVYERKQKENQQFFLQSFLNFVI